MLFTSIPGQTSTKLPPRRIPVHYAYPLPLADEVQHRLANPAVFTTLHRCTRQIVEKQLFVWDQKWVCINFAICHSV